MEKRIKIGNKVFNIKATAGVLIIYKQEFGTDYTEDMQEAKMSVERTVEAGFRLLWSMAKAADNGIPSPEEWLEELGDFDIEEAFTAAKELFEKSCDGITPDGGSGGEMLTAENLAASALFCKMSIGDLSDMTLSMVLNIISEYCDMRSTEGGVREATQEDFDAF